MPNSPVDTTLSCPSCGSPVEVDFRFMKAARCSYCGQLNYLNVAQQLDPRGPQTPPLVDYGSQLSVGRRGELAKRPFKVLGRVRYEWDKGFWDEWLLRFEDGERPERYWLQEDEGDYVLFKQLETDSPLPGYAAMAVGQEVAIAGYPFFITERRLTEVVGFEGNIPFDIAPGDDANFADGIFQGRYVSIEYYEEGYDPEVSIGVPVPYNAIELQP